MGRVSKTASDGTTILWTCCDTRGGSPSIVFDDHAQEEDYYCPHCGHWDASRKIRGPDDEVGP